MHDQGWIQGFRKGGGEQKIIGGTVSKTGGTVENGWGNSQKKSISLKKSPCSPPLHPPLIMPRLFQPWH